MEGQVDPLEMKLQAAGPGTIQNTFNEDAAGLDNRGDGCFR